MDSSSAPQDPVALKALCSAATLLRNQGKGHTVSYSPKVFIPLTRLCRDSCSYCAFRQEPQYGKNPYMTPDQVLSVARQGDKLGCREALFVLGDRPEQNYPEARRWLRQNRYDSTIEYLYQMCSLVLQETNLYPHSNPGVLVRRELESLKQVNVSLGLMLESISPRLYASGGPHYMNPTKHPRLRLRVLKEAGELKIPFTTGLLIGIGETFQDRIASLRCLRDLQARYGHLQEVIIQNFTPKASTPMAGHGVATSREILEIISHARLILGSAANIQAPPNLASQNSQFLDYLDAGINDWGGISPLTPDFVNPEAPWPTLDFLAQQTAARGYALRARFPVYPEFIHNNSSYLPLHLRSRLLAEADASGYVPGDLSPENRSYSSQEAIGVN